VFIYWLLIDFVLLYNYSVKGKKVTFKNECLATYAYLEVKQAGLCLLICLNLQGFANPEGFITKLFLFFHD